MIVGHYFWYTENICVTLFSCYIYIYIHIAAYVAHNFVGKFIDFLAQTILVFMEADL